MCLVAEFDIIYVIFGLIFVNHDYFIAVAENKRREVAKKMEEDRGMLDFMLLCYLLLVYLCIVAKFDVYFGKTCRITNILFGLIFEWVFIHQFYVILVSLVLKFFIFHASMLQIPSIRVLSNGCVP